MLRRNRRSRLSRHARVARLQLCERSLTKRLAMPRHPVVMTRQLLFFRVQIGTARPHQPGCLLRALELALYHALLSQTLQCQHVELYKIRIRRFGSVAERVHVKPGHSLAEHACRLGNQLHHLVPRLLGVLLQQRPSVAVVLTAVRAW